MGGRFVNIPVNQIVEHIVDLYLSYITDLDEPESEIIFIENYLTLVEIKDFKDNFISIAEWRDNQINSILDD
jgi:hypothetical protein